MGQTPLSEKLHNETSVDRVTTYFQNRQRKDCIILLSKIYQNQIELQLFSVAIVNGSTLKAEEKKILVFITLVRQKTHKLWKTRGTNGQTCFAAPGKFIHKVNGGNQRKKKTRDQKLLSNSQLIAKNVDEINLLFSCCWKIENLWISNFSQLEVSSVLSNSESTENNWRKKHHCI